MVAGSVDPFSALAGNFVIGSTASFGSNCPVNGVGGIGRSIGLPP
jgi:hypothetical protein